MKKISLISLFLFFAICTNAQLDELRIGSFNIRYDAQGDTIRENIQGDTIREKNLWETRKEHVCDLINFYDFDIVGTQEVMESQLDIIDSLPNYNFARGDKNVNIKKENGEDDRSYNYRVIYYKKDKFDLIENGTFWTTSTPNTMPTGKYDGNFCCTWAKLRIKESSDFIFIFNSHLTWHFSEQRSKVLLDQINKITRGDSAANIILTGDFNYNQTSCGYRMLVGVEEFKFNQIFCKIDTFPYPWMIFLDCYETAQMRLSTNGTTNEFKRDGVRRERIDHIFLKSNRFIVDKYVILTDVYYNNEDFDFRFPSDHYPVMSVLKPVNPTNTNGKRNKIKTCSYNVGGFIVTGPNCWSNRLPLISKSILLHDVDIVGIQTANVAQLNQLKDSLNYDSSVDFLAAQPSPNTAILYNSKKYSVCKSDGINTMGIFNLTSNANDQTNVCTWIKLKDISNSFEFFVFNACLDSNNSTYQNYCVSKLKEKILEIAGLQPVFVTSTFSFNQNSPYYNDLNTSCVVKDAYDLSPIKYNSERSVNNNFTIDMIDSLRKDFIFTSPHFSVVRHGSPTTLYWTNTNNIPSHVFLDTLPMNIAEEGGYNPTRFIDAIPNFSSDHFPIIVELKYYNCN